MRIIIMLIDRGNDNDRGAFAVNNLHGRVDVVDSEQYYLTMCVYMCILSSILQGSSVHPSRRLGYVSPVPQAIPKDLVIIHSRGSTWGDLFRGPPVPS